MKYFSTKNRQYDHERRFPRYYILYFLEIPFIQPLNWARIKSNFHCGALKSHLKLFEENVKMTHFQKDLIPEFKIWPHSKGIHENVRRGPARTVRLGQSESMDPFRWQINELSWPQFLYSLDTELNIRFEIMILLKPVHVR